MDVSALQKTSVREANSDRKPNLISSVFWGSNGLKDN